MKDKRILIIVILLVVIVSFVVYNFSYRLKNNDDRDVLNGTRDNVTKNESDLKKTYCPINSIKDGVCIEIYKPVCGWFNPIKIQCIKYPCAETFSNSCFACSDDKVEYWTEEECPA